MNAVAIRGHHIPCILTHGGDHSMPCRKEYSPAFTDNMGTIISGINKGKEIKIAYGSDDICAALLKASDHICDHGQICTRGRVIKSRDLLALEIVSHELQIPMLRPGHTLQLKKGEVSYLREGFAAGINREVCAGLPVV